MDDEFVFVLQARTKIKKDSILTFNYHPENQQNAPFYHEKQVKIIMSSIMSYIHERYKIFEITHSDDTFYIFSKDFKMFACRQKRLELSHHRQRTW